MRQYSNERGGKPHGGRRDPGSPGGGYNREHREHRSGGYRESGYRSESRHERRDRPERSGSYRGHESHPRSHSPRREESGGEPFKGRPGGSWVEISGRTVEEAAEEAARRFNVSQDDLKREVVEGGSKGFLGIGSKPARIKVALKTSAIQPFAEGVLTRILRGMSLPDNVRTKKDPDGNPVLNIEGPSSGTLIGRHGHTLESLQYLVSKVVQRVTGDDRIMLVVDVENYLDRQRDKLKELAMNLAQKAKETGVEVPLRPMSSKDRRVVHLALKEHEHVTTESRGEGLRRKVVIVPKVKAPESIAVTTPSTVEKTEDSLPAESQGGTPSVAPTVPAPENQLEPGNVAPKEPEIDDNMGNRA